MVIPEGNTDSGDDTILGAIIGATECTRDGGHPGTLLGETGDGGSLVDEKHKEILFILKKSNDKFVLFLYI